jgi:Tol biopolymer transport system component
MYATVPIPQFALSPGGRTLAFVAAQPAQKPTLWLRQLEDVDARSLAGTEDARDPFWSPDGRWIGFFDVEGTLKRVAVSGGTVHTVTRTGADPRGASWGPDDTILFGTGYGGVYRVAADGGTPQPATQLNTSNLEGSHRWPQFLPDGRHFLFTVRGGLADHRGVYVGALGEETRHQLLRLDSDAHYVAPGYLLFLDGDTLMAQAFDTDRLRLSGQATPIESRIGRSSRGNGAVSFSRAGTLAYATGMRRPGRLMWVDRSGAALSTVGIDGDDFADFRLSRDEKRLAASLIDPKLSVPDIWLFDLARGGSSKITFGSAPALNAAAVWSPQGERLAFRSNRMGLTELFQKDAGGGAEDEPLMTEEVARKAGVGTANLTPTDWSSTGQLAFTTGAPSDIWLLTIADPTKPVRIVASPGDQMHGNFSPDGSFLAFTSNETSRFEVFAVSLRPPVRQWPVSVSGGYEPRWRADGRELYYLGDDQTLMAVPVSPDSAEPFGTPRPLFPTQVHPGVSSLRTHYVANRDGTRFLIHRRSRDVAPTTITVVLNAIAALER